MYTESSKWKLIEKYISEKFTNGEIPNLDTIIFIIGLQELGLGYKKYKKDEKINIFHISICKLLEPYGFYKFEGYDKDRWPHYKIINQLPNLKANEQQILMKKAIIQYFLDEKIID